MKKIIYTFLIIIASNSICISQYANLGTGNLKNNIWWFDWNNFLIKDGASRNFVTDDGLNITVKFSSVQGPIFDPYVMNTWYGSVLHFLYDFSNPNIKPALYGPYTTSDSRFTLTITATRNGTPSSFKFIAADAEASASNEVTSITTSGSSWNCIDFFKNSSQTINPFNGCNSTTAKISDTYGGSAGLGQNPVVATDAPSSGILTLDCVFNRGGIEGQMGIAFGIFSSVDRGDLPASYGYASHMLSYTNSNPCSFTPPYPTLIQSESLKLGNTKPDSDPIETLNDNAFGSDEDGLSTFPTYTNNGTYSVQVALSNTTGGNAYLTGWFDFNRNGVFDINESATNEIPNNSNNTTLTWTGLPPSLLSGTVKDWAFRFRLSTDLNSTQKPTGFSPDGEVEDYLISTLQVTKAEFAVPDTVCVNTPVTITNTSINESTAFWNFCVADINSTTPEATNLGNIGGKLGLPVFIDYVQYNGNYFGFLTNNFPGKLIRLDFGNSLLNAPTAVDLGNIGVIPNGAEGIQMAYSEGRWYAIIVGGNSTTGGSRIVKIDFGADLTNTSPIGTNWGNIGGMEYPGDLHLFMDNNNWYAFTVDQNSSLVRFSFGSSFTNSPTALNFGNVGGAINWGDGIYIINNNGQWHGFICSRNNSTITRIDFGSSLLNSPVGISLGNPDNMLNLPRDIYITKFCNQLIGFVVNEGSNDLVKLNFSDLTSVPSAVSLGSNGNLSFPHSISKLFRVGSDLYSFIPNVNNNTLTKIRFVGCNNSNIPNFSGSNPPPVSYSKPGIYNINLTIDDGLPTQESICKPVVVIDGPDMDFNVTIDTCNPSSITLNAYGANIHNPVWDFGDGKTQSGNQTITHSYLTNNPHKITLSADFNGCLKTITKNIDLSVIKDDIILTRDTIVCFGNTKKLLAQPALNYCWSPVISLDNPYSQSPITSTKKPTTYYCTSLITGVNLVNNGEFNLGNSNFLSEYNYSNKNNMEDEYFVGVNPKLWNDSLISCVDHTNGTGNMLMINGSHINNKKVWEQEISLTPNTNYAFSAWIQSLDNFNPAQLEFSINDKQTGVILNATSNTCNWKQFYTIWNSGTSTTATLGIIYKTTQATGNRFALDDISFAPVSLKQDSVTLSIDTPVIKTNDNFSLCESTSMQLNTTGAKTYSWNPAQGLSSVSIGDPIASPKSTTPYIVTGIDEYGCQAKDTVVVSVLSKPYITKSSDITICKNDSTQLFAKGGISYTWSPTSTLSNSSIADPIATPATTTTYYVIVSDTNNCTNKDSILVSIRPEPTFSINNDTSVCYNQPFELHASGGDLYAWEPSNMLNNSNIKNPITTLTDDVTFSVKISDTLCNNSDTLYTSIQIKQLPSVKATKSNDIDCTNDNSQLNASGAITYKWSPPSTLSNPTIKNPLAQPTTDTKYTVIGTDINGCTNMDTITVKFISGNLSSYLMPNAFTPNNDGLNDCYGIKYWGIIKELEFSIYNRWGQRIFFTKDPNQCWDGNYKGNPQPMGVYIYVINAKTFCGDSYKKGTFTLIR